MQHNHTLGAVAVWFALMVSLSTVSGCADSRPSPPVADSTLVKVFVELHLASARAEMGLEGQPGVRDSVLQRYGISEERFEEVMAYYVENPDAYVTLYDEVLNRLEAEAYSAPVP